MLAFEQVVKAYRSGPREVRALTDVSFAVDRGEFVTMTGPSGSGKSTLLRLAGGLEDPTAGRIRIGGRQVAGLSQTERATSLCRDIGYVFQRLRLLRTLTAEENVMLPLEVRGMDLRRARSHARNALASVGLNEALDRQVDEFSAGEQQRIAIARAVVGKRRLILADEPTAALDAITAEAVMVLFASLANGGAAVLLVTNDSRHLSRATRRLSILDGRVADMGSAPMANEPAVRDA